MFSLHTEGESTAKRRENIALWGVYDSWPQVTQSSKLVDHYESAERCWQLANPCIANCGKHITYLEDYISLRPVTQGVQCSFFIFFTKLTSAIIQSLSVFS